MRESGPPPENGTQATVIRVDFGGCELRLDDGRTCDAIARGRLMGKTKALGNAVVVGDRVTIEVEGDRVMIADVAPRRNAFSRRASGKHAFEQVVAANLDQLVLVCSIEQPEFRPGLADRVLAQAEYAGVPALLVVNKQDLDAAGRIPGILDDYRRAGYVGHRVCAKSGHGIEALLEACLGRRSLFVGHSGVGKSTLLNALSPGLDLESGGVNLKTGKGRHTTTAAWLRIPRPDLELIDTPGVRTFGLWGVGADDLERSYPEFRPHLGTCRFADCRHDREPGCAVRAAVLAGEIAERRFGSFLNLREELTNERGHE
jgi:ribosome biogenesis GTPase